MHDSFWRESQNSLLKSASLSYKIDCTPRSFQTACTGIISHSEHMNKQTNNRSENSEQLR